ncbi:MAG: protein kinase domain-containing protein [Chloroflexus sp.]|uniref:protein kinase domain-containing protein n=1 Tax=Chloroflexus sp. TaxID=1904827 RepID=UPI00404B6879
MPKIQVPGNFRRFYVQEYIGRGLSGEVYRATFDGREVALKIFCGRTNGTEWNYFTNEELLLRQITKRGGHPHIVEFVHSNLSAADPYIATAFVSGQRLDKFVSGKRQRPALVVRIIDQLANALDYLHHADVPIVHRDVKPENIMVDRQRRAVLIDFGIASSADFAVEREENLGTPPYMAPEQYQVGGEKPASDQFALALVAFFMLTGKRLLPSEKTAAVDKIRALKDTNYKEMRAQLKELRHTADVLARALEWRPDDRYPDCSTFAKQLRTALVRDGKSPDEPAQSSRPVFRSQLGHAIAGSALIITVATVLVVLLLFLLPMMMLRQETPQVSANLAQTVRASSVVTPWDTFVQPTPTIPQRTVVSTIIPLIPLSREVVTMKQREPLRAGPSTDTKILLWMPEGAQAERTGRQQPAGSLIWYEVIYNGQIGWCRSIYCIAQ